MVHVPYIFFLISLVITPPGIIQFHFILWQAYDQLEFFAGVGNITKQARACGYRAARFDIIDNERPPNRKTNFMDLTSASGFALLGQNVN